MKHDEQLGYMGFNIDTDIIIGVIMQLTEQVVLM
jgi:hypothetical protein